MKPIESVEKKKDLPTCTEVVEELGDGEGAIVYPRPKYEAGWEEERELSRGKMMRCWLFRLRTLTLTGLVGTLRIWDGRALWNLAN